MRVWSQENGLNSSFRSVMTTPNCVCADPPENLEGDHHFGSGQHGFGCHDKRIDLTGRRNSLRASNGTRGGRAARDHRTGDTRSDTGRTSGDCQDRHGHRQ